MFPGCPLCWAAGAALIAPGAAGAAVLSARKDFAVWVLAFVLAGTGAMQRWGEMNIFLPWWWYVALGLVLYARVGYLLFFVWRLRRCQRAAELIHAAAAVGS